MRTHRTESEKAISLKAFKLTELIGQCGLQLDEMIVPEHVQMQIRECVDLVYAWGDEIDLVDGLHHPDVIDQVNDLITFAEEIADRLDV